MKVYYAHSMHLYDKPQEQRDIKTLSDLGFEVYNPNMPTVQREVEEYRLLYGDKAVMDYFKALIENCQFLVFRAHPDGKIPSGVAFELEYAKSIGLAILELPTLLSSRNLLVEDTRQYLALLGQR